MKKIIALLLLVGAAVPAFARYEIFLSTSPDNKLRMAITQEVLRRVGDQVFFEYPIYLTNKAGKRIFLIEKGTVPLVNETDRGTFTVDRGRVKFEWAADSKKCLLNLEVSEGEWHVYLVDAVEKTVKDITPDLTTPKLVRKLAWKKWECQRPVIELVKWQKPDQPVFHLTTQCVKPGSFKYAVYGYESWVLYDTVKKKVVKDCPGCEKEKALKYLAKEPKKKKPKPTPVPEETPTAQ